MYCKDFVCGSLEQAGKKWVVLTKAPIGLELHISMQCGPVCPVWRTKEEYESTFPVLGKSKPPTYRAADLGISWRDALAGDSYNASFATALEEELAKKLYSNRLLQVINLLRKRMVGAHASSPQNETYVPLPERRIKVKSLEQKIRAREGQRLARQAKRMSKASQMICKYTVDESEDQVECPGGGVEEIPQNNKDRVCPVCLVEMNSSKTSALELKHLKQLACAQRFVSLHMLLIEHRIRTTLREI